MAWYDRFLGKRTDTSTTKQIEAATTADKAWMGGNSGIFTYQGPPSALLTALGITASASQLIGDPRLKMETYQTMVACMPEVSRMIGYHLDIMGIPEIESEDQVWADEANAMLREMVWKGQLTFEGDENRGLDTFIQDLAYNTLCVGQSFYSLLDSQGLPAIYSRQRVETVQLHASSRFNYLNQGTYDKFDLQYVTGTTQELNKVITPAFKSVVFDRHPEYPWGKPILYDAERIALEVAILKESQQSIYRETSSAPRVTLFGLEPQTPHVLDMGQTELMKSSINAWGAKSVELERAYSAAKAQSNRSGRGVDLTASVVGKITMASHSGADNIKAVTSYPEDIKLALTELVIAMKGVPDLVGLSTGGDGLGSLRSAMQMDGMRMVGEGLRKFLAPHVKHILETKAIRLSRRIPKYEIEWEGLSTVDLQAKALLESTDATTANTYVTALNTLLMAGEIVAAKAFAKEHDLEWFAPESETL